MSAKKQLKDYTPIRIDDNTWTIDRSFLTHWLIRGDIVNNGDGTYKRIKDDNWLPDHKEGQKYIVR